MNAVTQVKPNLPKFMLAAALLLWSWSNDRWWVGGLCLVLLEAVHWVNWRWDFKEKASIVAWRLSVLLLVVTMALIFLDGARAQAMPRVFSWLPLILLPLQFIESFGTTSGIPVTAFSAISRRNRDRALKHGLNYRESRLSFGYVYLFATLIAAALDPMARNLFFIAGFLAISSWAMISQVRWTWKSLGVANYLIIAMACGGAYAGQQGLIQLYRYIIWGGGGGAPRDDLRETSMGDISELKQSPDIKWRLQTMQGPLPRLLRSSSYQSYGNTRWRNLVLPPKSMSFENDYTALNEIGADEHNTYYIAARNGSLQENSSSKLKRFHLRGSMPEKSSLPVPGNAASLFGFDFQNLDLNSWGTIRFDPSFPVADGVVLWDEGRYTERPPWYDDEQTSPDLIVQKIERTVIDQEIDKIGLREGTVPERIRKLKEYFAKNFTYTRNKDVANWLRQYNKKKKADDMRYTEIGAFLAQVKRGHCEFFATAGTLMMREAGIPARYAVGFAVKEFDPFTGEAVIRGTHAHAWSRVWDEAAQSWVDADFTPPNWLQLEPQPSSPRLQKWKDRFLRSKEDFLVWRNQPGHMALITAVFMLPVLLGLAYIGRILWRSRKKDMAGAGSAILSEPIITPLHQLAETAVGIIGPRPQGQPLGAWLAHLSPKIHSPEQLDEALKLHQWLRFDPRAHITSPEMTRLQELAETLTQELKALTPA
jgi:protein-glutamine gamma-glutamyltransferase